MPKATTNAEKNRVTLDRFWQGLLEREPVQAALAERLGGNPLQITRWKQKPTSMPLSMLRKAAERVMEYTPQEVKVLLIQSVLEAEEDADTKAVLESVIANLTALED